MNLKNKKLSRFESIVKNSILIIFVFTLALILCSRIFAAPGNAAGNSSSNMKSSEKDQRDDDSQINIYLGDSYTLKVTGGAPPFLAKEYDQAIISITPLDLHTFLINTKAVGSTQLKISNRKGDIVTVKNITVSNKLNKLAVVFDKDVFIAGDIITPSFSGGTPPYKLVVVNAKIAELLPNQTNTFKFMLKIPGKTQLAISDSTGQVVLQDIVVQEKPKPVTPMTIKVLSSEINVGDVTTLTIDGGAPPYSVNVQNNKIVDLSQTSPNSFQITGKIAGSTLLTVSDSKSQAAQQIIAVIQKSLPLAISISPDSIFIGDSATLTVAGGTPPFSINALNSKIVDISQTGANEYRITGKLAGTTTLTIFDARKQNAQKMIEVLEKPIPVSLLTASLLPEIRVGETTILSISGGTPPYKVAGNNATLQNLVLDIAPMGSNSYSIKGKITGKVQLIISDAKGQSISKTISVVQKSLSLSASVPAEVNIGEITTLSVIGGTPPYTVKPNNNLVSIYKSDNNNYQIKGLATGVTLLVIYDAKGIRVAKTITVKQVQKAPLVISMLSQIYVGESTSLVVNGGAPPYNISVPNNFIIDYSQSGNFFQLKAKAAGEILITIIDSNGQMVQKTLSVVEKPQPLTANIISEIYVGDKASLTVSGGTPPYDIIMPNNNFISVTHSGSTFYLYGQSTGTISLNIVDSKGQSMQQLITVLEKILPLTINLASPDMEVGDSVNFTVSGGTPPYYVFNQDNNIINITQSGTNNFKIIAKDEGKAQFKIYDSGMQSVFKNINVDKKPLPLNVILPTTQIGIKESITFTVTGNPPYSLANLNPDLADIIQVSGDSFKITGAGVGNAQFVIFDSEGQNVLRTVAIINPLTISFSTERTQAGNDLTLSINGGIPPYYVSSPTSEIDILSSPVKNNQFTISSSSFGEYKITVFDSKGQQVSKNITFYPMQLSTLLASRWIFTGKSTVLVIKGGVPPYTVAATDDGILKIVPVTDDKDIYLITGLAPGDTKITVTDSSNSNPKSTKTEDITVKLKW